MSIEPKNLPDQEIISLFLNRLKTFYENPENLHASIKISVSDYLEHVYFLHFYDKLIIEKGSTTKTLHAQITLPLFIIYQIIDINYQFDWNDLASTNGIMYSGDINCLKFFQNLCLRPQPQTVARFHRAERLHARNKFQDIKKIEYIDKPTQQQILEAIKTGKPVVLKGFEKPIKRKKWSIRRLKNFYGNILVAHPQKSKEETLSIFIENLENTKTLGHTKLPIEIWADLGPICFDRDEFIKPQLSIGVANADTTHSSLSRISLAKFYMQMIGSKKIELYSANQSHLLYPLQSYNEQQDCWFKPENPDYEIYPESRNATKISVILNQGETLLLPAGWFSKSYSVDDLNITVSYCWRYG